MGSGPEPTQGAPPKQRNVLEEMLIFGVCYLFSIKITNLFEKVFWSQDPNWSLSSPKCMLVRLHY